MRGKKKKREGGNMNNLLKFEFDEYFLCLKYIYLNEEQEEDRLLFTRTAKLNLK